MKRLQLLAMASLLLLFTWGCAQHSVLVSKGSPEVRGGYKGVCVLGDLEHTNSVLESLCSGDLEEILDHTSLSFDERDELLRLSCSEDGSAEKVYRFYTRLPDDKKGELVRAFQLYGYHLHGYG